MQVSDDNTETAAMLDSSIVAAGLCWSHTYQPAELGKALFLQRHGQLARAEQVGTPCVGEELGN